MARRPRSCSGPVRGSGREIGTRTGVSVTLRSIRGLVRLADAGGPRQAVGNVALRIRRRRLASSLRAQHCGEASTLSGRPQIAIANIKQWLS
jgi:hypothetical protein